MNKRLDCPENTPVQQLVPNVGHYSSMTAVLVEVECQICLTLWIPLGTGISTWCGED